MGEWSPAFYADDLVLDVRGDYGDLLRIGKADDEAERLIISCYSDILQKNDPDEPRFWMALAMSEWKRGRLSEYVKGRAMYYLDNGSDLERYRLAGNENALKQREAVLRKVKNTLLSPQPQRKKASVAKGRHSPWPAGSLLAYKICLSEDLKDHPLFGKYALVRVVKVQKHPISRIAPSLAYDESLFLGIYGWVGSHIPDASVIEHFSYIPYCTRDPLPFSPDAYMQAGIDQLPENAKRQFVRLSTDRVTETCMIISHYYFSEMKKAVTVIGCDPSFCDSIPPFFHTEITSCPIVNPYNYEHQLAKVLLPYRETTE